MGLHIALWSESMSSPCKALGLILSTKGRWREERRRKVRKLRVERECSKEPERKISNHGSIVVPENQ